MIRTTYSPDTLLTPTVVASPLGRDAHPISWTVFPSNGLAADAYKVDLYQLAHGYDKAHPLVGVLHPTKRTNSESNDTRRYSLAPLVQALVPVLLVRLRGMYPRTAQEFLTCLRWLFRFIDATATSSDRGGTIELSIMPIDLKQSVALDFIDWMRQQELTSSRLSSIYAAAKSTIESHLGQSIWPVDPFQRASTTTDTRDTEYTEEQYRSLTAMCRDVLLEFRSKRNAYLRTAKRGRSQDPTGQLAGNEVRDSERGAYAAFRRLVEVKEAVRQGTPFIARSKFPPQVLPTLRMASAGFLLVMLRTGANEQPCLDFRPGRWRSANPFLASHRNLVTHKNRAGSRARRGQTEPKRVIYPAQAKPTFHAVRVMRYHELASAPLRAHCAARRRLQKVSPHELALTEKIETRFWLYRGEKVPRVLCLEPYIVAVAINRLIKEFSLKYPALTTPSGPLRYSARAIRNSYFAFAVKKAAFQMDVASQELSHTPDSPALINYLSTNWARAHAKAEHRSFTSAVFSIVNEGGAINPDAVRQKLEMDSDAPSRSCTENSISSTPPTPVHHGFLCKDPSNPPPDIYEPKSTEDCCPAEACHDCPWAQCFESSLPELARDIADLERQCADTPLLTWEGSDSQEKLKYLLEVFSRFPVGMREKAQKLASSMARRPSLSYRPQRRS